MMEKIRCLCVALIRLGIGRVVCSEFETCVFPNLGGQAKSR